MNSLLRRFIIENLEGEDIVSDENLHTAFDSSSKYFITPKEFTGIKKVPQIVSPERPPKKPEGLWYACGSDWIQWSRVEAPWLFEDAQFLYEIDVNYSRVIAIRNEVQFDQLDEKFGGPGFGGKGLFVMWPEVAAKYAGIEICPYIRSKRMTSDWYYPWDVASGCIWDPSGLNGFTLVATRSSEGWRIL